MKRWGLLIVLLVLAVVAGLLLNEPNRPPADEEPPDRIAQPEHVREARSRKRTEPVRTEIAAEGVVDADPSAVEAAPDGEPRLVTLRVELRTPRGPLPGGAIRLHPGKRTRADDAGIAEVHVEAGTTFELEAELPGHSLNRVGRVRLFDDVTIPLLLVPDRSLRVTITDEVGAAVRAKYVLLAELLDDDFAVHAVLGADEHGVVVRDGLPRRQCVVVVRQEGFATVCRYVDGDTDAVNVQLARATEVSGTVTIDDRMVRGAAVWLGEDRRVLEATGAVARTDDGGRFRLTDVPADARVWLRAEHEELGAGTSPVTANSDRSDIRIRLVSGDPIRGRVVDNQTHAGVAGVEVISQLQFETGFVVRRSTRTDDEGQFVVHGHNSGAGRPRVATDDPRWEHWHTEAIEGDDGSETFLLTVKPRGTATGRVVDPDGRPIAGARVFAGAVEHAMPAWSAGETYSAANGRFRLDGLRRLWVQQLGATHPDGGTGFADFNRGDDADVPVTIVLSGLASISGRVVDQAGRALTGFTVRVHREFDPTVETLSDGTERPTPGLRPSCVTDSAGAYTFAGLPRGMSYRIVAWPPAGSAGRLVLIVVRAESSSTSAEDMVLRSTKSD